MKALLEHGADVNRKDADFTVLHRAVIINHIQTVKLLLDHHANPNIGASKYKWSPLFFAKPEAAELLIAHGADVNGRDAGGQTALFWTAPMFVPIHTNMDTAKVLLSHGADTNARDNAGNMPVMRAAPAHDVALTELFIAHGADLNARDVFGCTALMYALQFNSMHDSGKFNDFNEDVKVAEIRCLLQHGAKVNIKDRRGWTALDYANDLSNHDEQIVQMLKEQQSKEQTER